MSNFGLRAIAIATIVVAAAILLVGVPGHTQGSPSSAVFSVTVNESGLWPGWSWYLVVNGTGYFENNNTTTLTLPDGSYNWSVNSTEYTASPDNGTFNVTGSNTSLAISFAPSEGIEEIAGEFGYDLPIGGNVIFHWTIINYGAPVWVIIPAIYSRADHNLPNVTPPSIIPSTHGFALMPNSGYTVNLSVTMPYNPWDVGEGWEAIATASANYNGSCPSGICIVGGVAKIISGGAFYPYYTNFTESGLPSGTSWTVSVNAGTVVGSSTSSKISIEYQNGTFPFSVAAPGNYTPNPAIGTITLNGSSIKVHIKFTPTRYSITFNETGLARGTRWHVMMDGLTHSSTSKSIEFALPDGSYNYSVANVANYTGETSGTVSVGGAGVRVLEKFSLVKYSVTMKEVGLPSGTIWSATIGTKTLLSTSNHLYFHLANGTYSYSVANVPGYSTTSTGTLTVVGTKITVVITFAAGGANEKRGPSGPAGLPHAALALWPVSRSTWKAIPSDIVTMRCIVREGA